MDFQKSLLKLTRNQSSSLLRSSTTIRSSVHSLMSVNEEDFNAVKDDDDDDEEKLKPKKSRRSGSSPGFNRFTDRVLATALFTFSSLILVFFVMKKEELTLSENLLIALSFIAITLFFMGKNKDPISRIVQSCHENSRRLFFSRTDSTPIQWYIGNSSFLNSNSEPREDMKKLMEIRREGVEFYKNGDFYEGEFYKGKCNGSGVHNYYVSGRYEGDWVDGKYDGYGIESWAKGSRYRGQYRRGSRHGFGVYNFYTGDSYAGEWFNGQSHGFGVQNCADGSCFIGEFKRGVKHGLGCYYFRNGDKYAGEYFGDKIHGFGAYHFANGHCYEGSWHEGRRQGYGVYTFKNSDTKSGEWDIGSLKYPLPPQSYAILQAVQASRKASKNAINLQRVDGQVNNAVMAANRAATAARVAAIKAVQNQMDSRF